MSAKGTTTNVSGNGAPIMGQPHQPPAFFPLLVERARGLSKAPPRPSGTVDLPPGLRDIGFEDYHRTVTFKPEKSLWRSDGGRFEAQFFHMGHGYREPVAMFTVEGQTAKVFPFSTDLFEYVGVPIPPPPDPATLNFTGLRLHAPINKPDAYQEFAVFQGASYFRIVGRDEYYGLSGRGLALDTGEGSSEEFPRFTEMYLEHPQPSAHAMWVMMLLESKRVVGAYAMLIEPGGPNRQETTVEIISRVFFRESVKVVGVAPMTSMFLFGKERPANFNDYRPEVHDSDGLVMLTKDNEWVYRHLRNPPKTGVCHFRLDSPRGYGLVQRERTFAAYQDINERYQDRPSAWIEPLSDWGPGSVRLFEMATPLESDDNIGAMWVPDQIPADGLSMHYRMHVADDIPIQEPVGRVVGTRFALKGADRGQFIVDFAGLPTNVEGEPRLDVSVTGGQLTGQQLVKNQFAGTYRVIIDVTRQQADDIELRATIRSGDRPLTEIWSYLWQPAR